MRRTTKYVGLDVHQASIVAAVRDDRGRVIAESVVPTEAGAIVDLCRGMRGAVHVVFEEGTQAQWLHDLLVPVVHRVVVCDRRGERRSGNKGDRADAAYLAAQLWRGDVRAVYHGGAAGAQASQLKELARAYTNLVEDATRVMARLKALFRARGIPTKGTGVYAERERASWLGKLPDAAARFRAETLYAELAVLQHLRPRAKAQLVAQARRDPAWAVLRTVPFLGPVRVALLLATLQTPWRFRTKRHLWAYAGLAVVTATTAEYTIQDGRPVRRRRPPMTRGLNRNHSRVAKNVFKQAALAAATHTGALQECYQGMLARGMRADLARVTLARKLAALTLHLWKTHEPYDPTKLTLDSLNATTHARSHRIR